MSKKVTQPANSISFILFIRRNKRFVEKLTGSRLETGQLPSTAQADAEPIERLN